MTSFEVWYLESFKNVYEVWKDLFKFFSAIEEVFIDSSKNTKEE